MFSTSHAINSELRRRSLVTSEKNKKDLIRNLSCEGISFCLKKPYENEGNNGSVKNLNIKPTVESICVSTSQSSTFSLVKTMFKNSTSTSESKIITDEDLSCTTTRTTPIIATHSDREFAMKRCLSECSADQYIKNKRATQRNGQSEGIMWRNELRMDSNGELAQIQGKNIKCVNGKSHDKNASKFYAISDTIDVMLRIIMVIIFIKLETMQAFRRRIQVEEMWLYKNPRTPDIVSPEALLISVIFGPFLTTLLLLLLTRDRKDFRAASWTWTLALCLNGICTSLIKVTVGRPRPDFFFRCFPDGIVVMNNLTNSIMQEPTDFLFNCTGNVNIINEGRKSFPSGHSSFAFTGFGFITFYIGGKLHAFNTNGRGETWRLLIASVPLMLATLIAISRTCDYHHHFLDVTIGAIIGILITYLTYRQYYPSIFDRNSHRPHYRGGNLLGRLKNKGYTRLPDQLTVQPVASEDCSDSENIFEKIVAKDECKPLIQNGNQEGYNKWS